MRSFHVFFQASKNVQSRSQIFHARSAKHNIEKSHALLEIYCKLHVGTRRKDDIETSDKLSNSVTSPNTST
jgi:hypothetical protein